MHILVITLFRRSYIFVPCFRKNCCYAKIDCFGGEEKEENKETFSSVVTTVTMVHVVELSLMIW